MAERVTKEKTTTKREEAEHVEPKNVQNDELGAVTDDLLDEIDEVLEAHTEEEAAIWVANYRQKGGQ